MKLAAYLEKYGFSQKEFGQKFKPEPVSQGLVHQWLAWLNDPDAEGATRITAERAIQIEKVTGGEVPRHVLRPDLFDEARAA